MIKKTLIIARYHEPLNWLKYIDKSNNDIFIYNKGNDDIFYHKKLPNVGRESHTILTYIVDNYDSLPEHCIFLQGDPSAHTEHDSSVVTNIDLRDKVFANKINNFIPGNNYHGFSFNYFSVTGTGNPPHMSWQYRDTPPHSPRSIFIHTLSQNEERVKHIEYPARVAACFYVPKANILRHSKEVYKILLDEHYIFEKMPYVLECAWHLIFDNIFYI